MTSVQAWESAVSSHESAAERRVLGLLTPAGAAMGALLLVAFAGLYFRWFVTQARWSWAHPEDWAHAFFVPLISGYIVLQRRAELAALRPRTFWPGLAPLLLGVMSYFFFVATRLPGGHMIQGWAVILTVFGLVLLLLGPRFTRLLFLPTAFLVFGVTISDQIMIRATFPLQLMASYGAWVVLAAIGAVAGFMVDRHGNTLTVVLDSGVALPPLDVAEACSGMRMVVAFFALAAVVAILGANRWWQRVALVLSAAPVAILLNIARVSVLGLVNIADPNLATGQAHTLIGTLLLIPGLGLFMAVVWALNRAVREERRA